MAATPKNRVEIIKSRGAVIALEQHAEVLVLPTGPIGVWTNRMSRRVGDRARQFAPTNKRARWGYEDPNTIKGSITVSTAYDPATLRVHSAVGVKASHGLFVERGTGMYNLDNPTGPYEAKILPPWMRQSPSLYESTWAPGGNPVRKFMIKGQKPQQYLERGLEAGMMSMLRRYYQLPDLGGAIAAISDAFPTSLVDEVTGGLNKAMFMNNLREWRDWRDRAFGKGTAFGMGETNWTRQRDLSVTKRDIARMNRAAQALTPAEKSRRFRANNPQAVRLDNIRRSANRDWEKERKDAQKRRDARLQRTAEALTNRQTSMSKFEWEDSPVYKAERKRVTELLRARGLQVVNVRIAQNGTFRAVVRRPGSRADTPVNGKWR